jgi:uncharacterized membrane protein YfcA
MGSTIIILSLIIVLSAFTQGLTGLRLVLVSVPLLSLTIDAKMAVPIAGILDWLATFPIAWKKRHQVQYRAGLIIVVGSIPASFFGAKLLANLSSTYILISLGVVLIVFSIHLMSSSKPLFKKTSTPVIVTAGFFWITRCKCW